MKTRTIAKVINKKFDDWVATIKDESVRKKVEKGSILTGGAIASMLLQQDANDFDFYFKDKDTAASVARYYVDQFNTAPPVQFADKLRDVKVTVQEDADRVKIVVKSAGVAGESSAGYQYFESLPSSDPAAADFVENAVKTKEALEEKPDYRPVFLSANAITLSGKVQLVIRFYGMPEEIHANYDFVHATNYWASWTRVVSLQTAALECLLTKELRYIGSKYPICSLIRARKFIQRDWSINAGQLLKIAMQISELDLTDFAVLEEQLAGMDVAYFMQVLDALKEKDPTKINAAYLVEIIDRIFG